MADIKYPKGYALGSNEIKAFPQVQYAKIKEIIDTINALTTSLTTVTVNATTVNATDVIISDDLTVGDDLSITGELLVDNILEKTAGNGVVIDGVTIKDGGVSSQGLYTALILPTAPQAISGAGAINVTTYKTNMTTTGSNAYTLANGTTIGFRKRIQMIVDGGDGVLTPTSLSGGTTITFADAGDVVDLIWNGTAWVAIDLFNCADGATAPVLA